MIPVDHLPFLIDAKTAVRIAIMRNAEIGMVLQNGFLQRFQMCGAAVIVDIHPIGQRVNDLDLSAKLPQNLRHYLIRSTIRAVQNNIHSVKTLAAGAQNKFHILVQEVGAILNMSDLVAGRTGKRVILLQLMNDSFQLIFDSIRKFVPIAAEKLDAVVMIRIMGSRNDNACFCLMAAGQIGNSRSRDHSGQHGTSACRTNSCRNRCLKHLAGQTRIPPDQNQGLLLRFPAEIKRSRASQPISHFRLQRNICLTANAIRTKQSCHNIVSLQ